jgi:hypothetical protein
LLFIEIGCPSLRRLFVKPDRFATADAQLLLAFLNLYGVTGQSPYLDKARQLGEDLLSYSIPGYSGYCWGYPFDWQNQRGMWRKNTPYITCTPYCFDAFLELYDVTGEPRYLKVAESIAEFVANDLRDTTAGSDAAAASYSPTDNSQVINASAYRAWVLLNAAVRFGRETWRDKAVANVNFVLQSQRSDGSWMYATDRYGQFIDHFHTCFVLKNLFKLNRLLESPGVAEGIRRGFDYYHRELFHGDGTPKSFVIQPRTGIVRLEMYNFAEAISLGVLLRQDLPAAWTRACQLADLLCRNYQLPDGHFVTRVYVGGIRHQFPFMRWPQSQLFLALTNLLRAIEGISAEALGSQAQTVEIRR